MTAAFYTGRRQLEFRPCEPRSPGASEVRIEVAYGGVCGSDLSIYHGRYPFERMITGQVAVEDLPSVFEQMESGAPAMKALLKFK